MNRKVKKFFKYMFIIFIFGTPLLYLLGGNNIIDVDSDIVINHYYSSIFMTIEESVFMDLYYEILSPIFGDTNILVMIYSSLIYMIFIDLLFILFDVLMFIPNVVSKMLDKIGKVGVKDE